MHIIEAMPQGSVAIDARYDDFMRELALESTEELGDVATVGHLAIARGVTADEIGAADLQPGDYAIVTDNQGFVYGFFLPGPKMADLAFNAADEIQAAFDES